MQMRKMESTSWELGFLTLLLLLQLVQGHFDVLAGLALVRSSEQNSTVLTAGTDGIVCMFDCQKKQPLWKYMLRVRHFHQPSESL